MPTKKYLKFKNYFDNRIKSKHAQENKREKILKIQQN